MISSENGLLVATVLLNVEGRDPGGFVADAREAVRANVALPPGYIIGWSGRFENQARAERRLMFVVPLVLLVIFLLLVWTYHSFGEAAHVLLAVPFALSGGLYLVWLLGYNFSVAVWVGFIALFGTAVQTAVVMVIYLQDAVHRKRAALGDRFDRGALREAVVEGALLRLRPKIMTVSTVVAGLLPIMWSQRVGAEVMRPLATPVLGGMLSSLAHVLIVTPLIFVWIHGRALPKTAPRRPVSRRLLAAAAVVLVAGASAVLLFGRHRASTPDVGANWPIVRTEMVGDVKVAIRSEAGSFRLAATSYVVEFTNAVTGRPVDVSALSLGGAMAMPGMVMTSPAEVSPARTRGRFIVRMSFDMSGMWQMKLAWHDAGGDQTVTFDGDVQ
jgi:Cu(I)/Ag(I) efflux system membrane protein CusA/SilA